MVVMRRRWLAFLVMLAAPPALADCPLDLGRGTGMVVFSEHFIIAVRPEPLHFGVGEPFALILNVCTKDNEPAELMSIDAQLDEKNVIDSVPNIVGGKDGRYRAEGLVVTAPGSWEVGFNVRSGKDVERLTHDLVVN
jgi:hypothetical protein